MSGNASSHILILGGGIIGLSTAYALLKRGHAVTVLERGPEDSASCAVGSAGMICPSHFVPLAAPGMVALGLKWMWNPESPFYIKPRFNLDLMKWGWNFLRAANAKQADAASLALRDLSLESRRLYLELAQEWGPELGLEQRGMLMLCQTEHALEEESATAAKARVLGIPAETISADAAAKLDPNIQMNLHGAVYFPQDCHLHPRSLMNALKRGIQTLGGKILWQCPVQRILSQGRSITGVETPQGTLKGDEYLICGGAWSPELAQQLNISLPMQAGKGYSLTLPNPPAVAELCSILVEARVAVTPMAGGMRFGGTMEIAGTDESINPRRIKGIIRGATRYFPQFKESDFAGIQPWSGLRPCSPDGLPYLGRCRNYENLSAATGHAMLGLSLAPATGAVMAALLSGEQPPSLSPLFNPDRFL
jgi:D-amino-acid dehydrogenase